MLRYPENAFIMRDLFIEWAHDVLFPEVERRGTWICGRIPGFEQAPLVILDGLKQHVCDRFFDIGFEEHIDLHVIPPHSSDQVKPCDPSLFAAAKNILARLPTDPELDKQCQDIDRLVSAIQSASMIKNVKKVLNVLGFASDMPMTRSGHAWIWRIAPKSGILLGKESLHDEQDRQIVREPWRIGLVATSQYWNFPLLVSWKSLNCDETSVSIE
jgi:hypothetical protein